MLALPLAPSTWHGPEVASVLAVSATALLAGQRWAVALVVIAELLLLPTIWPRAFLGGVALWPGRIAALVLLTGRPRTGVMCRRAHAGLLLAGLLIFLISLL